MADSPNETNDFINDVTKAWEELAKDTTFAGRNVSPGPQPSRGRLFTAVNP